MIVCSVDSASEVGWVGVPSSWVVIRYHDHLSASVFVDGQQAPRLVRDIKVEDLLGVIEEIQSLVVGGG